MAWTSCERHRNRSADPILQKMGPHPGHVVSLPSLENRGALQAALGPLPVGSPPGWEVRVMSLALQAKVPVAPHSHKE